jgi:D-glycero-D-manno-heptose 1,7-bisphosphate phosphatase
MEIEIAKPYLDSRADELLAAAPAPRKALFLDRDGVINVDHGYVHRPEDTEWVPGIFELCAQAQQAGYLLIVVTNQAGIARGYYSVDDFIAYTSWIHGEFLRRQTPLLATYYCPHHPVKGMGNYHVECHCRKPRPGMILAARERLALNLNHSLLIGDKASDVEAGRLAGISRGVLVTGRCIPLASMTPLFANPPV